MSDLYIDNADALTGLCNHLQQAPWLALDTEFVREKTYFPELCLIQIATDEVVACIDPLALSDLEPLIKLIYNPKTVKVFHAAYQDLEIFYHLRQALPSPVFDTQIAAALLGQGEQVSYANLVKAVLGVELNKSEARTDWTQRPLLPAQLAYAANDVRYLSTIYVHQRKELARLNRTEWLTEDFAALSRIDCYAHNPHLLWQRISGSQRLRGVQLAVLRNLAMWREEKARSLNRPRKWILRDDILVELARRMPKNLEQLKRVRGLESKVLERDGETLLDVIVLACSEPQQSWPSKPLMRPHLRPEQEALVDAMMALVRLRGAQQKVSPQFLANRKDLEHLLLDDRVDLPLLHGWRAALAGNEVQALIRGEVGLEVRDSELQVVAKG